MAMILTHHDPLGFNNRDQWQVQNARRERRGLCKRLGRATDPITGEAVERWLWVPENFRSVADVDAMLRDALCAEYARTIVAGLVAGLRALSGQPARERKPRGERTASSPLPTPAVPGMAEAFARFGAAPAFREAFTAAGKLRKGWTLVGGAPQWIPTMHAVSCSSRYLDDSPASAAA